MQQEEENITYIAVNELRIGSYLVMNGGACVILEMSVSKTGKHGAAKAHIVGRNIFTDKKVQGIHSTSEMVKVPIVTKKQYLLLNIYDDVEVSLLDEFSEEKNNLVRLDDSEVCRKVVNLFNEGKNIIVSVIFALGLSRIIEITEEKEEKESK